MRRRGEAGILGAVLIAFLIIASIATYTFIARESDAYINTVNKSLQTRELKAREKLDVYGYPDTKTLEIKNTGDINSHIVALVLFNNDTHEMKYYRYDYRLSPMDDIKADFPEMQSYPPYIAGVLTSLGNIFWDEVVTGQAGGGGGGGRKYNSTWTFGAGGGDNAPDVRIYSYPYNPPYLFILEEGKLIHVVNASTLAVVKTIALPNNVAHYLYGIAPTEDGRYLYIIGESAFYIYIWLYDLNLNDFIWYRREGYQIYTYGTVGDKFVLISYHDTGYHYYIIHINLFNPSGSLYTYTIDTHDVYVVAGSYGFRIYAFYYYNADELRFTIVGGDGSSDDIVNLKFAGRTANSLTFVIRSSGKDIIFSDETPIATRTYPWGSTTHSQWLTLNLNYDLASLKVYLARYYKYEGSWSEAYNYYDEESLTYVTTSNTYTLYKYRGKGYYWKNNYKRPGGFYIADGVNYKELRFVSGSNVVRVYTSIASYYEYNTASSYPPLYPGLSSKPNWIIYNLEKYVVIEKGYIEMYKWDGTKILSIGLSNIMVYRIQSPYMTVDLASNIIYLLIYNGNGVSIMKVSTKT